MIVRAGEDRIALIGKERTVKIAKANPITFGVNLYHVVSAYGIGEAVDAWVRYTADQPRALKSWLLRGIAANQREGRLARDYAVVVPTVSILGGAVNLQPTAEPLDLPHRTIHGTFTEHLGPRVTRIGHMLERPGNLGVLEGYVRFVDGGSRGLEELMRTEPAGVERALIDLGDMLGRQAD